MASVCKATREISKLTTQSVRRNASSKVFSSWSRVLAAQNFTMPAMSPTMTEGNIASWKVKEGDSFSTGDVLLEIETDKAHMDVEAQDDGNMAKIIQQDGAKGVKVGTRIAVIAEIDDDLSSLEIPAEESTSSSSPQEGTNSRVDPSQSSEPQAKAPPSSNDEDLPPAKPSQPPSSTPGKPQKQTYPLYPSIVQLFHEKGIPPSEADKIPTSGPKGRLLKGDVLAYLGRISSSYSSEQSARITKLGHLDLSNVTPTAPKETSPPPASKAQPSSAPEPKIIKTEIVVPISLSSVLSVQKRIQSTFGVTLPLSTFIARAAELANEDLPRFGAPPTADELFNNVLGLNSVSSKVSRGHYIPQITALPSTPFSEKPGPQRQPDIYDMLTETASLLTASNHGVGVPPPGIIAGSGPDEAMNVFSVTASKCEEKRARVFLERVKTFLQVEPGRLIL